MHIQRLPVALGAVNDRGYHDQRFSLDEVADASLVFVAVAGVGRDVELESEGEGEEGYLQKYVHHT